MQTHSTWLGQFPRPPSLIQMDQAYESLCLLLHTLFPYPPWPWLRPPETMQHLLLPELPEQPHSPRSAKPLPYLKNSSGISSAKGTTMTKKKTKRLHRARTATTRKDLVPQLWLRDQCNTSSKARSQSPERLWHGTRGKRSQVVEPSSFCPDFISAPLPCFFFLDHQTPIRHVIHMCSFTCHATTVSTAAKRVVA